MVCSVGGITGLLLVVGCSQQDGGEVGKLVVGEPNDPWVAEGIVARVIERGSAEYVAQFDNMGPTVAGSISQEDLQVYAARLGAMRDTTPATAVPSASRNAPAKALVQYSPG